jgi:hypothetical protein
MNSLCRLSLFVMINVIKTLNNLLRYGAGSLKSLLLLTAEIEFVGVVVHATSISIHLIGTLLVKFFQPGNEKVINQSDKLNENLFARVNST